MNNPTKHLPEIELDVDEGTFLLYVDASYAPAILAITEVYHENGEPLSEELFSKYEDEILDLTERAIRQRHYAART